MINAKIEYIQLGKTYNITFFLFSWVEILFNPRSPVEKFVADVMRFIHPYLAFVTYRFHVEKARDAGM
jgi:hypothetical protein